VRTVFLNPFQIIQAPIRTPSTNHAPNPCVRRASPLSAAVTWEYMRRARAAKMSLAACLEQDWKLIGHFVPGEADYWEGVRARLIDKDEAPVWKYERVQDVGQGVVEGLMGTAAGQQRLGVGEGEVHGGGGGVGSRL